MNRESKVLPVLFLLIFFLSGCINEHLILPGEGQGNDMNVTGDNNLSSETVVERIPFPVSEYASIVRSGRGTVKGSIYLVDASGRKIFGRHTRLYLNPVTSYSRQWYTQSYINGKKMGKADPRLFNYLKFTSSDKNGNFAFYGVGEGRYYLIGIVKCAAECGYDTPQNIRIAKEVYVKDGETVETDLDKAYD